MTQDNKNHVAGALIFGVAVLTVQGSLPLLLGSLAAEHRLSDAGIGIAASAEAIAITLACSLAGLYLKAEHLRMIAVIAVMVLALANGAVIFVGTEVAIVALRAVAGVPEGVLFWICLGMIARTVTTERWGAVLNTFSVLASIALTGFSASYVIPRFRIDGAFALLAALSILCLAAVPLIPTAYPALHVPDGRGGHPPARGWWALLGTMLFTAAGMGVFIYLWPLAQAAGLNNHIADAALTALLVGELLGGGFAMLCAGRLGYFPALTLAAIAYVATWPLYVLHPQAALFIGISAATGLITFFAIPFLFPLAVGADGSRRTALQSGAAQMLGTAVGPFAAAWTVARHGIVGVLYLSGLLLAGAMVVIAVLRITYNAHRGGIS